MPSGKNSLNSAYCVVLLGAKYIDGILYPVLLSLPSAIKALSSLFGFAKLPNGCALWLFRFMSISNDGLIKYSLKSVFESSIKDSSLPLVNTGWSSKTPETVDGGIKPPLHPYIG